MIFQLLIAAVLLCVVLFAIASIRTKHELTNHWSHLIVGLSYSTQEYYDKLEARLKEQGVEGITFATSHKVTGGMFSQKRIYMVVNWKDFTYEICAAPFGKSFFISYWAQLQPERMRYILSCLPFGQLLARLLIPITFYKIDTSNMFNSLIHMCITEVADDIANEKNIERMTEYDRPASKDLFKR